MADKLLSTTETLKALNISRPTLYDWMRKGILKPVDMYPAQFKRRPKLMFRENEVRALMPAEHVERSDEKGTDDVSDRNKPAA